MTGAEAGQYIAALAGIGSALGLAVRAIWKIAVVTPLKDAREALSEAQRALHDVERQRDNWVNIAFEAKDAEKANSKALRRYVEANEPTEITRSIPPPSDDGEETTQVRRYHDELYRQAAEEAARRAQHEPLPRKKQTTLRDISLLKLEQGWDPERPRDSDEPPPIAPAPKPFTRKR
jgi:hypothetical protein